VSPEERFVSCVFGFVGGIQQVSAEIQNTPVVGVVKDFEIQICRLLSFHGLNHAGTTNGFGDYCNAGSRKGSFVIG
jgi:hypothetical protein